MIAVINILFPVISIILLGVMIGKIEALDSNFFSGVNRLVYKYGLAPLLFVKTAGMSVPVNQAAGSITVMILLILFLTATAWIAAQALSLSDKSRGAFLHGSMRGNYAYIGLPVIFYAFSGTAMDGKSTEMAIIIFTPAIIFHNGLAIFLMNYYNRGEEKASVMNVVKSIARDPLIIGCMTGLLIHFLPVSLPLALSRTCESLGRMAMPLALIGIGATMDIKMLKGNLKAPFIAASIKTILGPAVAFFLIGLLGIGVSTLPGKLILILSACSTGVSTFIITEQFGGDSALAGSTVFISAVMSVLSLTAVLIYIH